MEPRREEFESVVIFTVHDRNNYLALKNNDESENIIGKPERMIIKKDGFIPEMIEKEVLQ